MPTSLPIRVIVRLPYNRPEEDFEDPPRIEWNAEKENILWEVIARSRASDSGGTDWQGLSAHLEIPLPYLLYRAQTRYEQDLRGLQVLRGALSPTSAQPLAKTVEEEIRPKDQPDMIRRLSGRKSGGAAKPSSSLRLPTPLGIRARLNSLGYDSPGRQSKASSSSVLTLQGPRPLSIPIRSPPSSASDSQSESDEEADKAEEEERRLEEEEALDKKLKALQKVMTNDALGLVREPRRTTKGKEPDRGRHGLTSPRSPLRQSIRRSLSTSESASGTSSPQGSIPSIPSPTVESLPQSPISRHLSPAKKSSSPPVVSAGNARGQSHMQYRPIVGRARASEKGSNHGSNASSFSDISETSISASALESALLSNIRGGGSRISAFARSQFGRRASSGGPSKERN